MNYNEDQIINEIKAYVGLTYEQHDSKSDDGFQVQDVLRHLKINKDFSIIAWIYYTSTRN